MKKILNDVEQKIVKEYIASHDFVSEGQVIKTGSVYIIEEDYPSSHHIDPDFLFGYGPVLRPGEINCIRKYKRSSFKWW